MSPAGIYDQIGHRYAAGRRSDPAWAALIHRELGQDRCIVNVGAGTGSYEPMDRSVVAVEPSAVMLKQRPEDAAPAVRSVAEQLPFADQSFDVALAVLTLHHWEDWRTGVEELRRISRRQLVVTFDPALHFSFWLLRDYLPEVAERVVHDNPAVVDVTSALPRATVVDLPVGRDMRDGVLAAYWCRPRAYLDPDVRANCSGLATADQSKVRAAMVRLERDLESGEWRRRNRALLTQDRYDAGYRLVVSDAR